MPQPLEGIRVLDFTDWETGPLATQFMGDFGAEVVKIEQTGKGGWHREAGPIVDGIGSYWLALNHSKRSLSIDLKAPQAREIVNRLVEGADCVAHNFRPGVMKRLGFTYEEVKKINPTVVYAEISGWGLTGPYRFRKGQDMLAQGMSGAMFMIGSDGEPPQSSANYKADYICGMQFLAAVTMALMARMRFGVGQKVHVSLLGAEVHNQIQQAEAYLNAGVMLRGPDRHRAFKTRDGWIANSLVFEEICETVDRGDLCRDPRFDSVEKQWANLDEWRAILEPYFLQKTTGEWEDVMAEKDIMGGPVLSYEESFKHPQVAHQDMVAEVDHPHGGTFKTLGLPLDLSETPMKMSRRPPALGEHTAEILGEAGYSPGEIETLVEQGVVQRYPAGD